MGRFISILLAAVMAVFGAAGHRGIDKTATSWQEDACLAVKDAEEQEFHPDKAVWHGGYGIDVSEADGGIVMVSCTSDKDLRIRVTYGDQNMDYVVPGDGTPFAVPLSSGSGRYGISVMERFDVSNFAYDADDTVFVDARIKDALSPYLCPNGYVPYGEGSSCVKKAGELAKQARDEAAFVDGVATFIRENITYDESCEGEKLSEHPISPDNTLLTGKGVCLDYAALVTAMLRSQGVPAKLVFGHVSNMRESIYHAWTEAYIDGDWVVVDACLQNPTDSVTYCPEKQY